jgi:hypothetical protein
MLPSLVLDKVVKLVEMTTCNPVMRFERHRVEVPKGQAHQGVDINESRGVYQITGNGSTDSGSP